MATLEDSIDSLSKLDGLRDEAIRMRDAAMRALTKTGYAKRGIPEGWGKAGDYIERAIVLKALRLCVRQNLPRDIGLTEEELQEGLVSDELWRDSNGEEKDKVPHFRVARVMQALVSTPGSVFHPVALRCYYRILVEIHTAHPPDWMIGGVQGAPGGAATAFVTGECVRAILGLAAVHETTANLIRSIRIWQEAIERANHALIPLRWREQEKERANRELFVDIAAMRQDVFFKLDDLRGPEGIPKFVEAFGQCLLSEVTAVRDNLKSTLEGCSNDRKAAERDSIPVPSDSEAAAEESSPVPSVRPKVERASSAHLFAIRILHDGTVRAEKIMAGLGKASVADSQPQCVTAHVKWQEIEDFIREGADRVRKTLRPAESFLRSVLDRELTEAQSDARRCDYPELAFAAASWGALQEANGRLRDDDWDDHRLERAAAILAEGLGSDGLFPVGRPIQVAEKGYRLDVVGAEVTNALARLLRHSRSACQPEVVRRMMRLFQDTRDPDLKVGGWGHEHMMSPPRSAAWTTGLCGMALHRIVRMLDACISRQVLPHFLWRIPDKVSLSDLFYPDFGIASSQRPSLSVHLQRMRAHLLDVNTEERLWSLVLHGPPGTGKTTIAEALALSAKVRLVEITPSDLMLTGSEEIERRARTVFRALAMLTDVVILFDEFDSVLKRRPPDAPIQNTFAFLTPGMLPKLKELYEGSSKRRVAYLLATNLVGTLDEAAIRAGRFDAKVGVYPPDPVSRTGRLVSQLQRYGDLDKVDSVKQTRIIEVVHSTSGGPMSTLGKPDWFTARRKEPSAGSPIRYFRYGGEPPKVSPEKRASKLDEPETTPNEEARRERIESLQIERWDGALDPRQPWEEFMKTLDALPGI